MSEHFEELLATRRELASLRSQLQQRERELAERDAELEVLRLELKAAEDGSGITNIQQQHDAQLAERDGVVLALTDACQDHIVGRAHVSDAHRDRLRTVLSSTSSAAADARRRVVAEGLREAAKLCEFFKPVEYVLGQPPHGTTVCKQLAIAIRKAADSLARPVPESGEGER